MRNYPLKQRDLETNEYPGGTCEDISADFEFAVSFDEYLPR